MNIDELKNEWQSLKTMPKQTGDTMVTDVVNGKLSSAREHLMTQYKKMFAFMAPFGCVVLFALAYRLPLSIVIVTTLYILIAAAMDYYLYRGIKGLDLSTEGVTQIVTKAKFYRRRHHQFQLFLIPVVVILIGLYFSFATEWEQKGLVVGVIIGLVVGLPKYLSLMRDYKQLQHE
jgi:membrane-associated HD superfamily phosphohydrolase